MKTLVFLSDRNRYLEHELYLTLVTELKKDFHCLYLDSEFNEQVTYNTSEEQDREEKKVAFDVVEFLPSPQRDTSQITSPLAKLNRIISNLSLIIRWRRALLKTISEKNPAAVIMIAPNNVNAQVIRKHRNDLKLIYIQPATLRQTIRGHSGVYLGLLKFFYSHILGVPKFTPMKPIFQVDRHLHFFLWSFLWVKNIAPQDKNRFHFLGSPIHDRLFARYKQHNLPSSKIRILIILNKEVSDSGDFLIYASFYKKLIKAFPEYYFIIKKHPLSDLGYCKTVFPDSEILSKDVSFEEVDFVLTHWSTLAFSSIAIGVPTILINPGGQFDFQIRYMDQYGAIAESIEELNEIIEDFKDVEKSKFHDYRQRFMELSLFSTDGQSRARVVRQIKSIATA